MTINGSATSRREHDLEDLCAALHGLLFPARQDDILAALVAGRSPSRLLWRAGHLSPERLYLSIDEVCAELRSRRRADRQDVAHIVADPLTPRPERKQVQRLT